MRFEYIKNYAVKAIAICSTAAVSAGFLSAYMNPAPVSADDNLYTCLYDVFRDRSDDPDNFMTPEFMVDEMMDYCEILEGVEYTYGDQEHYLACDGFVSLVFRLTFGTAYEFERTKDEYWIKFDRSEEHIVAGSYVDQYEIYRPGGTSVTWLYKNYVNEIVEPLVDKTLVEDMTNDEWVEFLDDIDAQPGDIMFWDEDKDPKYWTHIGIYAGEEDGVPMMWHASSIQGAVVKQPLEEITYNISFLDYVCIVPTTTKPAKVGLYVDRNVPAERDFSYSIYRDAQCSEFIGRISNVCSLSEQDGLSDISIYMNNDGTAYERTLYAVRDISPYAKDGGDMAVYQIIIRIERGENGKGTLKYSIYGADDLKFYYSKEIINYDYRSGYRVIELKDFR